MPIHSHEYPVDNQMRKAVEESDPKGGLRDIAWSRCFVQRSEGRQLQTRKWQILVCLRADSTFQTRIQQKRGCQGREDCDAAQIHVQLKTKKGSPEGLPFILFTECED